MKNRFCPYCQQFRPDTGFKFVTHPQTGSQRGQCPRCQEMRSRPRQERERLAKEEAQRRREVQRAQALERLKERKTDEQNTGNQ